MSVDIVCMGEPLLEFNQQPDSKLYLEGFGGDTSNAAVAAARFGSWRGIPVSRIFHVHTAHAAIRMHPGQVFPLERAAARQRQRADGGHVLRGGRFRDRIRGARTAKSRFHWRC